MSKKRVLYEIITPDGEYCWEYLPPHEICEHFDSCGGNPKCDLGFYGLKVTDRGVIKPSECVALREVT